VQPKAAQRAMPPRLSRRYLLMIWGSQGNVQPALESETDTL
jgi:hypothetical protein